MMMSDGAWQSLEQLPHQLVVFPWNAVRWCWSLGPDRMKFTRVEIQERASSEWRHLVWFEGEHVTVDEMYMRLCMYGLGRDDAARALAIASGDN
jgi:hypothetical protein